MHVLLKIRTYVNKNRVFIQDSCQGSCGKAVREEAALYVMGHFEPDGTSCKFMDGCFYSNVNKVQC